MHMVGELNCCRAKHWVFLDLGRLEFPEHDANELKIEVTAGQFGARPEAPCVVLALA